MIGEQHRGICPEGYHVPTDDEWNVLAKYVDEHNGAEGIGTSLKSRYLWQARDTVSQGTDLFGFAALPGDNYVKTERSKKVSTTKGFDDNVFRFGAWWSASEDADKALDPYMQYETNVFNFPSSSKTVGDALRCLQDP